MVESYIVAAFAQKAPAPPIGVTASLVSGFEAVNARLELIFLPLALDLFLWLGPHLSVSPVVNQLLALINPPAGTDPATLRQLEAAREVFQAYGADFNLFSFLSTAPLGLPSLLAGREAVLGPGGSPPIWLVHSVPEYLLLFGSFVLVGLFFGALYFGGIAQQVREARLNWLRLMRQVWGDWARLTALLAMALLVALVLGLPVLVVAAIANLVSPVLGGLTSLVGWMLGLWALFYAGFTLHGIILQRRGLFPALWDSLRLVQANLPPTAALYMAVVVLSLGLGVVWNIPADDSWFLLIGLVGHALVSTALVAATFIFYQDRYRWWIQTRQTAQARAQAGPGGAKAKR